MLKTKTQKQAEKEAKQLAEQKAFEKDLKRAEELMRSFAQLSEDKSGIEAEQDTELEPIKKKYAERLSPVVASMKEAEEELKAIGERNKKRFEQNKLPLEHGYLLKSQKTVVKVADDFPMSKFVAKYPDLVKIDWRIKELNVIFTDGDAREKLLKSFDLDLKKEDSIEVKPEKKTV